ncbi:amino acid ABC transporter substrate-binding protein [Ostreibacterium oceani]|uniref:Transporter substrate-binding domain-containing protein n=1 Tax=Ostreibacterium oceani TaxID=2654998 RepID=A0A6N7EZE6_9GAMM|nr:amino acid ABC transporter substrate-binding protein [Ostreibacterium oceani]MPV86739.1 transporter substrate-binding domain-containing protein [Ostreibacterium oceani]
MKKTLLTITAVASTTFAAAQTSSTLDAIKSNGMLKCGVVQALPGFAAPNDNNEWHGLDAEYCRGLAAAIFGDGSKVQYVPLSSKQRFTALQSGEVDVLARVTTETLSRDGLGIDFVGVNYYDGQGFMVRKDLGVTSAKELSGAAVCSNTGTTTESNMSDYFNANGMEFKPVIFEKSDEVKSAYEAGRCDVYSSDASGLYVQRSRMENPDEHIILPEIISKEPLAIAVREGDNKFADIARWSRNCSVNAEELGVTKANVEEMKKSEDPKIQRLLGVNTDLGEKSLGLDNAWCANQIKAVGNYGEIFETYLGKNSSLKIERGLNKLWNDGGLMYAAPIR